MVERYDGGLRERPKLAIASTRKNGCRSSSVCYLLGDRATKKQLSSWREDSFSGGKMWMSAV